MWTHQNIAIQNSIKTTQLKGQHQETLLIVIRVQDIQSTVKTHTTSESHNEKIENQQGI